MDKSLDRLYEWAFNPVSFVEECIRPPKTDICPTGISQQQRKGLQEYGKLIQAKCARADGRPLSKAEEELSLKLGLSIQSGQGTGKDAFASWVVLHFLVCMPYCKILCTAPSGPQLHAVLWPEIHKWLRCSILGEVIQWQASKIYFKAEDGREWFAIPRTINVKGTAEEQAETLAGLHEDNMLYVVDEASGVPDPVFGPIEGSMTGACNLALVIFNPTRSSGYALATQGHNRQNWVCLHWDAEESELVPKHNIEMKAAKFGRQSNFFRIRVKGLPPKAEEDVLIPIEWVQSCVELELLPDEMDMRVAGLDAAGEGTDRSVLTIMRGPVVEEIHSTTGTRTDELASWTMRLVEENEVEAIAVDVIGIGYGVADQLSKLVSCPVLYCNVAESPEWDEDAFMRLRDELWWMARDHFEHRRISIPNDEDLIGELSVPKYKAQGKKIKVESKSELRKRSVSSPDKADSLILALYAKQYYGRRRPRKAEPRREVLDWKVQ